MADFDSSDYLSSTDNTSYDPNVDTSEDYGSTSDSGSFLDFLNNPSGSFGISDLLKGAKNLFAGTGDFGKAGQLAAFGGLAALLNKMMTQKPDPVGYQYGVPRYTVNRTQTPLAQQRPTTTGPDGRVIPYRPGQGGITYFTPTRYQYAGYEPKKAEDFLTTPAGVTPPPVTPPAGGTPGGTTGGDSNIQKLVDAGLADPYIPPKSNGTGSLIDPRESMGGGTAEDFESLERAAGVSGNGLGSIANALNIKTSPAQTYQKQDYGQYGFDPALVNYLNQQRQQSVMDAGVDWTYDPSTQTFSGFNMSGPLTSSLAEMQAQAGIKAASGGYMPGGIAMLAGGRYLRGPGDGVSDSIPAKFERSGQPARLADGEFVIDARTVSEIGNGSSEAGARKLYAMMDRVHKARKTAKRGKPSGADKYLPK